MKSGDKLLNMTSLIGRDPAIIAPFVKGIFDVLTTEHILWAVMRGWETLPSWTRYDIDILVDKKSARRASEIVSEVGAQFGWKTYGVLIQGMMRSVWLLKEDSDNGQSYLRIDIETGNEYRGVEIHESQFYLKDRIWDEERKLWYMPKGYAGAAVLLKQLAVLGEVDTERRRSQVLAGVNELSFEEIVGSSLKDETLKNKLLDAIKSENWDEVKRLGGLAKRRLFRWTFRNFWGKIGYGFCFIGRLFNPFMRCFIVLSGPDGCGKTTVADAICDRFKGRPFQGLLRIHMLFGVPRMRMFKELLWRMVGKRLPPQVEAAPGTKHCGMQPPHSMFKSMMYVTYYGLGMICGRLKLLLWRPQGGLVLADRFFQDYYYMRGYMKCPKWYVRMMEFFAPTPDLIISLERPASDIYSQKPELDIEEIEREQAMIRKYLGKRKQTKIVDASHGVDATIAAVIKEVESWISSR